MMFETVGQAGVFLTMVYAGLCVGFVYDVLRFVRHILAANALLTGLLDLLFWLVAGAVVSVVLAIRGEDLLRVYAFVGCSCGAMLYLLGISRVLRACGEAISRAYQRAEESPRWQAKLEKQRLRKEKWLAKKEADKQARAQARQQKNKEASL